MNKKLSLLDATMIVAGSMIGSGIFIVSADITRNVGGAGWLIAIWIFTALLTLAAAVSYGELSAMFPKAGGQFTYLQEAFGKLTGFLYGWTLFVVIQTGTIAAVGVAFAKFTAYFFPIFELKDVAVDTQNVLINLGFVKIQYAHLLSVCLVLLLTYINTKGVRNGKIIQTLFTVAKVAALLGVIILGFAIGANAQVWQNNWQYAWQFSGFDSKLNEWLPQASINGILGGITAALVGSIFSADAWNNITFIAGEVDNPKKNVGLSLILGTGMVLSLYIAANLMYTAVLPMADIAAAPSDRVGVAVCEKILGVFGTKMMAILIMISTFGCVNGMILSGARVYYAMAEEKLFFKQAAKLNKFEVPQWALWAQAIWTSLLCLSGKYGDLLDYVVFAVLLFYVLTILAIFKLRKTHADMPRPYKALGYPVVPALYIVLAAAICILLLIYKPAFTVPGLIIVLLGVPVYFLAFKRDKQLQ
jgi:basic amino acid/polyamine antiporter, APA family